jgi:signal transduction histidine kinase
MQFPLRQTLKPGWLAAGFVALSLACSLQGRGLPLANAGQVHGLGPAEAAKGRPVTLRGTVTYYDPDWGGLYVQDNTGAVYVAHKTAPDAPKLDLTPGDIIEVKGKTQAGVIHPDVVDDSIQILGHGPLPDPLDLSAPNALSTNNEILRVHATGQITDIGSVAGRVVLDFSDPRGLFFRIIAKTGQREEALTLRGASVELAGVLGLDLTRSQKYSGGFDVFVSNLSEIHRIKSLSITTIGELLAAQNLPPGQPVRIRGSVENIRPISLSVRDPSGLITVEVTNKGEFHLGSAVEVFAWPVLRQNILFLTRSIVTTPVTADPMLTTLKKIAQIRDLSVPQAALGYPVHVRGVVTYHADDAGLHFVQDDSAGIYVNIDARQFDSFPPAGTRIELWGISGPGDFAPVIVAEQIRVLGTGQFPSPAPVTYQMLMTGAADSQWVALKGVVRSQTTNSSGAVLGISIGDAVIQAKVTDPSNAPPTNLVGAAIEAKGVCQTLYDERRRFKGLGFCVPGWDEIDIKEAGLSNPYQLPLRSINQLFEFNAEGYGLHRSHVKGRVILRQSGGALFVQDRSGGVRIEAGSSAPVDAWVEVVGFPALKDQLPILEDAIIRRLPDEGSPVVGAELKPDHALSEDLNATLVTLEARVIGTVSRPTEDILTVDFGKRLIDASLEKTAGASLPRMAPESTVRLTGVYIARLDNSHQIQSFQILLRSPADAMVTSVPAWWSSDHTFWTFGGLAGILLLALAWCVALRKQVQRRTAQLHAEIDERKHTEKLLKEEIVERKRAEQQIEKANKELVAISHQAGMAEVATSVLHNVGNVLNSVNVSSSLVTEKLQNSGSVNLGRAVALLNAHSDNLGDFLAKDPKGRQLPIYLGQLATHLVSEREDMLRELSLLSGNINHIKEIVAMQQNYARISGVRETLVIAEIIEEAVRLNVESLERHQIKIRREYSVVPPAEIEKHKVLQILVNLIQNAKNAMSESTQAERQLTLRVEAAGAARARITVIDNGLGIPPENLTKIFAHGFTTRKDGHGFGLHSGALTARQLGGSLIARSEGPGKGAVFVLEIPTPPGVTSENCQSHPNHTEPIAA